MNLKKCSRGHFYDADKYSVCPHCAEASGGADNVTIAMPVGDDPVTVANYGGNPDPITTPLESISIDDAITMGENEIPQIDDDDNKTISFYKKSVGVEPVVGWLVCTEGKFFGQSFHLKSGRNFIGRASSMDIVLGGDMGVSRECHAIITYEPRGRIFFAQPGESRELFYLNDKVVLENIVLKAYDNLSIGNTTLMFIPCCGPEFTWDMKKLDGE